MKHASLLISATLIIWSQVSSTIPLEGSSANRKTGSVKYEYLDLDDRIADGMSMQHKRRDMYPSFSEESDLNYNFERQSGDTNGNFEKQSRSNADPSTQTKRKSEFPSRTGISSIRVAPNRYNYRSVAPTTYRYAIPTKNGASYIEERNDEQRNSPIQFITAFITKLWRIIKSWFKA